MNRFKIAAITNTPVPFMPVELPLEVADAEPIKSVDAPVVVELKRAPIKASCPLEKRWKLRK